MAQANGVMEDKTMPVEAESTGNQHIMLGKAKQSASDLVSLRAENAAWKRIVSYMMQHQSGLRRRPSKEERWQPRKKERSFG